MKSLPSWASAGILIALTGACATSSSIRTPFDDEMGPRVDGSRIQRLSYVMEDTGESIPYAVYVPRGYTDDREWPLMVGFMGSGLHYDFLMGFLGILDLADRYGYVMVTPLGYVRGSDFGGTGIGEINRRASQDVSNVLEIVQNEYNIDPARTYLWGHSAGAGAAFRWASETSEIWGAVALLALPDDFTPSRERTLEMLDLPVLVQIGSEDTDGQARTAAETMREIGVRAQYLEVPGGHFLWMDSSDHIEPLFRFFEGEVVGEVAP